MILYSHIRLLHLWGMCCRVGLHRGIRQGCGLIALIYLTLRPIKKDYISNSIQDNATAN